MLLQLLSLGQTLPSQRLIPICSLVSESFAYRFYLHSGISDVLHGRLAPLWHLVCSCHIKKTAASVTLKVH